MEKLTSYITNICDRKKKQFLERIIKKGKYKQIQGNQVITQNILLYFIIILAIKQENKQRYSFNLAKNNFGNNTQAPFRLCIILRLIKGNRQVGGNEKIGMFRRVSVQ
ncbi:hypothetical protein TTHERM_000128499 (macronuclear) [Tetrahymena thermophila SB210]|uniref:Uncharacterized protein n=1 Tax=Tetrahymena thermophila (strain SB210) TaxID=312017 RepID=W7XAG8_TETTS|nr:hypothetical protein TTHERM_000128499 [Tetrahymena thermophila SB210]EWS74327.1 hypothetical protein TTHERM_000128499 [Tetrahymena thermophila SB210]|eukprot:XP_012653148.1 hypothetical protein TTHERM_000128499 [Tetrahymena thermophila SB210]